MLIRIITWSSITALLLAALWPSAPDYRIVLAALVLWAGAILLLKPKARPSIASIIDSTPRSDSL